MTDSSTNNPGEDQEQAANNQSGQQDPGVNQPEIRIQVPAPGAQPQLPFQIPLQTLQVQSSNPTQQLKGVEDLVNAVQETTKQGNLAESQVTSQINLIASAVLVIGGVVSLNPNNHHISGVVAAGLLVAVGGLGFSLIAGVMHYALERKFWYRNRKKGVDSLSQIAAIDINDVPARHNVAIQAMRQFDEGSNRSAFWIQISSFIIGISALLALIGGEVISKI